MLRSIKLYNSNEKETQIKTRTETKTLRQIELELQKRFMHTFLFSHCVTISVPFKILDGVFKEPQVEVGWERERERVCVKSIRNACDRMFIL